MHSLLVHLFTVSLAISLISNADARFQNEKCANQQGLQKTQITPGKSYEEEADDDDDYSLLLSYADDDMKSPFNQPKSRKTLFDRSGKSYEVDIDDYSPEVKPTEDTDEMTDDEYERELRRQEMREFIQRTSTRFMELKENVVGPIKKHIISPIANSKCIQPVLKYLIPVFNFVYDRITMVDVLLSPYLLYLAFYGTGDSEIEENFEELKDTIDNIRAYIDQVIEECNRRFEQFKRKILNQQDEGERRIKKSLRKMKDVTNKINRYLTREEIRHQSSVRYGQNQDRQNRRHKRQKRGR